MGKDTSTKIDNREFLEVIERAPLVAIDLIIRDAGGRILMGMRNNEPAKGAWFVPGGRIRKNETMDEAFERISRNELGIRYHRSQAGFLGVFECMYDTNFLRVDGIGTHYVVLAYEICVSSRPTLTHDEQHKGFRWFSYEEATRDVQVHRYVLPYYRMPA